MTEPAERDLLVEFRRGDHAALGRLLETYQGRLYNVCLRMVGNRDDAAEVTQDAMVKIIEHIENFRGDARLSTWMIRIAMNQSISHLRRSRLRRTVSLDASRGNGQFVRSGGGGSGGGYSGGEVSGGGGQDQAAALRHQLADHREPGPLQSVEEKEQFERLAHGIAQLDEQFRAVLVLRDIEQMEYRQIAEVLELNVGTVKSRLFRARLALRQYMTESVGPEVRRHVE